MPITPEIMHCFHVNEINSDVSALTHQYIIYLHLYVKTYIKCYINVKWGHLCSAVGSAV